MIPPPPTGVSGPDGSSLPIIGWFIAVLVAVGSPIASAWWGWRSKLSEKETEKQLSFQTIVATREQMERELVAKHYERQTEQQNQFYTGLMQEVQTLRQGNAAMQTQINELHNEIHGLRQRLDFYEDNPAVLASREIIAAIFNHGYSDPAWLHDVTNNRWYVNDCYCATFNVHRKNFWSAINIFGRYPIEEAQEHIKRNLSVIEAATAVEFTETVRKKIMDPDCPQLVKVTFHKVPIVIDEQPFIYGRITGVEDCEKV